MTQLITSKEFNAYLPPSCTLCEHFQSVLARQLANPAIEEVKPTITKCVPALLENGYTGRRFSIVYIQDEANAPHVEDEITGSCPDKLGQTGLNITR